MRNTIRCSALLALSTILVLAPGCDDSIQFSNRPPGGLRIERNVCHLATGESVTLTGYASDPEEDPIIYIWSADAGSFDPSGGVGQVVSWTAPASPGVYRIVLTVSDGIDKSTLGIDLTVGSRVSVAGTEIILDCKDYPYFIVDDGIVVIGPGKTLRVGPGVTVFVNRAAGGLLVEGRMIVDGTAEQPVVFRPNYCPGGSGSWQGITFRGVGAEGSLFHVTLPLALIALRVEEGASVECVGLGISRCVTAAIAVTDSSFVEIADSRIWENDRGINVENSSFKIRGSSVRYNRRYGIGFFSGSSEGPFAATVEACIVATNDGEGMVLSGYANPVINGNSIFNNQRESGTGFAIQLLPYAGDGTIDATGNYWGVLTEDQIAANIFVDPNSEAKVDFSGWLESPPVAD